MSTIFFDTCSILSAQKKAFEQNTKFYISSITVNELENIKTAGYKDEETKFEARKLLHLLEQNDDKYEIILYQPSYEDLIRQFNLPETNDSKIIITALTFFKEHDIKDGVFYTQDLACKAIAKSIGLKTMSFKYENNDEYTGFYEKTMSCAELTLFYNKYLETNENIYHLLENEYLIIRDTNNKIVDKYKWKNNTYQQVLFPTISSDFFGEIKPKNGDIYQQLALDSLMNNQMTMLRGPAGSGKSYLAFGYMFSLLEKNKIDKIIIFCNTVATRGSAKLGFYPGSRTEKLLDSQIGNLLESKLGGDKILIDKLIAENKLILLPMSDIRGYDTTNMNAAIYITEAQNLDIELMKLALQRIGEDSICILDGDSNAQVDLSLYAGENNGMRRVSSVFKGANFYGEVTLQNIYRSKIADLAEQL